MSFGSEFVVAVAVAVAVVVAVAVAIVFVVVVVVVVVVASFALDSRSGVRSLISARNASNSASRFAAPSLDSASSAFRFEELIFYASKSPFDLLSFALIR
eukprot:TRINITY_DN437_c0_g2_i3.p1 TRINITY_DN437_c0_g2~~TRINITY_DN437_c0_g2_i3.p1  ORF type:complete len:100 (-),score=35.39 TRINITY_DN437_c0_g2_i3:34-333(-)